MGHQVQHCTSLTSFLSCEWGSKREFALLATITIGTGEEKEGNEREINILTSSVCAVSSGLIAKHRVKVDVKARRAGWLRDGRC